jgi:hypothetical protein
VAACENGAPRIDPLLYRPRGDEPPGAHMSRATDAALRVESVRSSSAPPLRRPLEVRASRRVSAMSGSAADEVLKGWREEAADRLLPLPSRSVVW